MARWLDGTGRCTPLPLAAICGAMLGLSSLPDATAWAYKMDKPFFELVTQYVTPHVVWAKPYARGKVRALVIAPRGTQRETIELAQRMDLAFVPLMTLDQKELGWTGKSSHYAAAQGVRNDEVAAELRRKLRDSYDVLIVGNLDWRMFPLDTLYALLKKVKDGTGLVYTYSAFGRQEYLNTMLAKAQVQDAKGVFTPGVPIEVLPVLDKRGLTKIVQLRQFGKGRIATLDYGPVTPVRHPRFHFLTPAPTEADSPFHEVHYEYYQSLVIKAVLWAARREPRVALVSIASGKPDTGLHRQPRELTIRVRGARVDAGLQARLAVRGLDGQVRQTAQLPLRPAGKAPAAVAFPIDCLPRGTHLADVWITRAGQVVNWGSHVLRVDTSVRVNVPTLDKPFYEAGQTVRASLSAKPAPSTDVRLVAELVDTLGRVTGRQVLPCNGSRRQWSADFRLDHPRTVVLRVRASLVRNGRLIDRSETRFGVRRKEWDDFSFAVWSGASATREFVRLRMLDQLRRAGVDTFTNTPITPEATQFTAEQNFFNVPYMTRYCFRGKGLVRKPCLTNPNFLKAHLAKLKEAAELNRPYGPMGYTLGDECYYAGSRVDACFSPTCVADLQQWLKADYGSLDALNRSWGTSYKRFTEAKPIALDEAIKAGQIPRWVDHRRHMEFVYARMMARARDAIRSADPTARVGFDGPFLNHSWSGNDWSRLMAVFDLCNLYFHEPDQWEQVRSFAKPGSYLGLWFGGYWSNHGEDYQRLFPWRAVLHGYNSVWWYAIYHGLSTCPMDALTPSMTLYPDFRCASEEVGELKTGTGKALLHARRRHDAVAIHYSQPSVHASTFAGDFGHLIQTWRHWYTWLDESNLQYRCVSYGDLATKGLDPSECRVLVLPLSQAIAPAEAKQIDVFVRAGGWVIADVRPGLFDHHGKAQTPSLLGRLLGVRFKPTGKAQTGVDGRLDGTFGNVTFKAALKALTVDPRLELAGAKAMGKAGQVPIVTCRRVGRGGAVCLNFGARAYTEARAQRREQTVRQVLWQVMALAGVKPAIRLVTPDGDLRHAEPICFQDGPIQYWGVLKYRTDKNEQPVRAEVQLASVGHCYDVRRGQYLGRGRAFERQFVPARASLFAQLPYKLEKLTVTGPSGPAAPGSVVSFGLTLTARPSPPARHWVHVDVRGPDGQVRRHYGANVPVVKGRGAFQLPLAVNDPPGTWRIQAREVITGTRAETPMVVQKGRAQ